MYNKRILLHRFLPHLLVCMLLLPACLLLISCSDGRPQESSRSSEPSESADSSESSVPETKPDPVVQTFHYAGTDYSVPDSHVSKDNGEDGYFCFAGKDVLQTDLAPDAPEGSGPFTDLAVCNGVLCAVYENEPAVLPETGYVLRVRNAELKREPEPGITIRTSLYTGAYLPEEYVVIGGKAVEVRYHNKVRTDDNSGFLFDENWYTSTTFSNIWGTEVAVDQNGTIVEVRPGGTEESGNTPVPDGGYVLAVGVGSTYESFLSGATVGDPAEHVSEKHLYTVRKFSFNRTDVPDTQASSNSLYLSADDYETTPAFAGTDVLINADGTVRKVVANTQGGNPIPEGGKAFCVSGKDAEQLATVVHAGDLCVQTAAKMIAFLRTPQTLQKSLTARLKQAKDDVYKAKFDYLFVDFKKADELYTAAEEALKQAAGKDRAKQLLRAWDLLDEMDAELVPSVPFGERAAWVTIGETDSEGNPYLHYKDDESVQRSVDYAKRLNLTTLIIDPLASGYAVYPSSVRGILPHPELGSFDVVHSFAAACEDAGIELVVMPCALLSVSASSVYPKEHYVNLYESKRLKTQKGRAVDGYGAIAMDPSDPVIRKMITDMVTELLTGYPEIDGIQVDYIRYPLPVFYQAGNYEDFGYSSAASEAFQKQYKVNPATLKITDANWETWCDWRSDVITSFAEEISAAARAVKPDVRMGFTCFADANDRKNYVYQQPEIWAEKTIADAVYPMIYQATAEEQFRYAKGFEEISENADIVLGIGAYVRATEQSMIEQLDMPRYMEFYGASVFTLRYICVCGYNDVFQAAYRNPVIKTEAERDEVIQKRLDAFLYLHPDEPLESLRDKVPELAALPYESIVTELEKNGIQNANLKQQLGFELRYLGRYAF